MTSYQSFFQWQQSQIATKTLTEGGKIFKTPDGASQTQRIRKVDIPPTIKWLESITRLDLTGPPSDIDHMPSYWLGTTGRKSDSGDLDIMIDASSLSKDELVARLQRWVSAQPNAQETRYVKKSGISVHFLTPIKGDPKNGFVQTDFMFIQHPEWSQFIISGGDPQSQFKGVDRFVMINSLATFLNYKITQLDGLVRRDSNQVVSRDPDQVAKLLLSSRATRKDLLSVEHILTALSDDPKRDDKISAFREYLQTNSAVDNRDAKLQRLQSATP